MNIIERVFHDPDLDRLNNLVRWNGHKRLNDESVAHHSFIVTWLSRMIAEEVFSGQTGLILEITTHAIFHDFNEMFEGDVLHGVKYNDLNGETIRKCLKEYSEYRAKSKFDGQSNAESLFRSQLTMSPKDEVKMIVKLSDWLSMSYYLLKEIRMGNMGVRNMLTYCDEGVRKQALAMLKFFDERKQSEYVVNITILRELRQWNNHN